MLKTPLAGYQYLRPKVRGNREPRAGPSHHRAMPRRCALLTGILAFDLRYEPANLGGLQGSDNVMATQFGSHDGNRALMSGGRFRSERRWRYGEQEQTSRNSLKSSHGQIGGSGWVHTTTHTPALECKASIRRAACCT